MKVQSTLFDRSGSGQLVVTGPDAATFLHNLCTNDIRGLTPGHGCLAYFCNRLAKVMGQARIYCTESVGGRSFYLDAPAGTGESLLQHLDKHLISERVEFADESSKLFHLHLAGPNAYGQLREILEFDLNEPAEYDHAVASVGTFSISIRRNDLLGIPGYDLIGPLNEKDEIAALMHCESGSEATFESQRIEAGTPFYGPDIDDRRFVMEVGDAVKAVSYAKGCYLGQEPIVMARDRAGFVNRAMKIVKSADGKQIPARANLILDGKTVGNTTASVTYSPKYDCWIALAYIQRGHQDTGMELVTGAENSQRVVVT